MVFSQKRLFIVPNENGFELHDLPLRNKSVGSALLLLRTSSFEFILITRARLSILIPGLFGPLTVARSGGGWQRFFLPGKPGPSYRRPYPAGNVGCHGNTKKCVARDYYGRAG